MNDKFYMLVNEYLNIIDLIQKAKKCYFVSSNELAIDKKTLIKLLGKHNYLLVDEKLRLWRTFNLVLTERNRYTIKRVIEEGNKKYRARVIVINMETHKALKDLCIL